MRASFVAEIHSYFLEDTRNFVKAYSLVRVSCKLVVLMNGLLNTILQHPNMAVTTKKWWISFKAAPSILLFKATDYYT